MAPTNNGNISAALKDLKHRGWKSPTTLAKALRQLEACGLIAKTRKTIGVENGSTLCNLYRFTDMPVSRRPDLGIESSRATHDYKRIESLSKANWLVKQASSPSKKSTLQKLESSATDCVVKPVFAVVGRTALTPITVARGSSGSGNYSNEINSLAAH